MKPEVARQIRLILSKAVEAGWITNAEAIYLSLELGGPASKGRKKVKSPELGT